MAKHDSDRLAIRALIENWVIWRDARLWDRFRTVWHKDGQMWATWFQGSYEEFIKVSQEGYDHGVRINHMLGAITIDIEGKRAIAQVAAEAFIKPIAIQIATPAIGRPMQFIPMKEAA